MRLNASRGVYYALILLVAVLAVATAATLRRCPPETVNGPRPRVRMAKRRRAPARVAAASH